MVVSVVTGRTKNHVCHENTNIYLDAYKFDNYAVCWHAFFIQTIQWDDSCIIVHKDHLQRVHQQQWAPAGSLSSLLSYKKKL